MRSARRRCVELSRFGAGSRSGVGQREGRAQFGATAQAKHAIRKGGVSEAVPECEQRFVLRAFKPAIADVAALIETNGERLDRRAETKRCAAGGIESWNRRSRQLIGAAWESHRQ